MKMHRSLNEKTAAIVLGLFAMLGAAGCASTKVTSQEHIMIGLIPKPTHIWVYDFAATAGDVPSDSPLAGESNVDTAATQTDQEIAEGRQLGTEIATQLAEQIRAMGLPSLEATPASATPQVNDLVFRGYLLSIKPGSAAKRVIIGFGAGASELRTMVECFQVTAEGQRRIGSGTVDSGGSKTPGAALGIATFLATENPAGLIISSGMKVYGEASGKSTIQGRAQATAKEIASVLRLRFEEQGWIY
jgi:hypothetical protein